MSSCRYGIRTLREGYMNTDLLQQCVEYVVCFEVTDCYFEALLFENSTLKEECDSQSSHDNSHSALGMKQILSSF